MNQDPKRLLQDAAVDPSLRAELAAFGEHCATQPFDLHAGLARFESAAAATAATTSTATAATTTAVATSSKGLSALLGAKGLAWATGALLSASAVTWTVWPEPTSELALEPTREAPSAQSIGANTPNSQALPQRPTQTPKPALKQPGPNSALQAELRVVKQARQALAQGQNTKALTILNKAQTRFTQGALIPERKALTIIALFKTGKRTKARRQARSFLTKHPDSPMAAKIRRMLHGAKR